MIQTSETSDISGWR